MEDCDSLGYDTAWVVTSVSEECVTSIFRVQSSTLMMVTIHSLKNFVKNPTRLHGIITRKTTAYIFTAMKTSDTLTQIVIQHVRHV